MAKKKYKELPKCYGDYATVGDLLDHIKKHKIPRSAHILYQRIEDAYFEKHGWGSPNVSIKRPSEFEGAEDDTYLVVWSPIHFEGDDDLYLTAHY
jgi:hypothetical protein